MCTGYVYVLENDSFKDLVKIGSTKYDGCKRARELSRSSGVPTPFRVVYQVYVSDYRNFEIELHKKFGKYRISRNREFFRLRKEQVISEIEKLKTQSFFQEYFHYKLNLFSELKELYGDNLKENLVYFNLHQCPDAVFADYGLCSSQDSFGWSINTKCVSLDFMRNVDDNNCEYDTFPCTGSFKDNCRTFVELDTVSMIMCVDGIFKDEYIEKICS